jgi:hypothetical protein
MLAIKEEAVISMKPAMYHIHQRVGNFPPCAPAHAMTYTEASNWVSRQSVGKQMFFTIIPASN